jgi:hypothetical protein
VPLDDLLRACATESSSSVSARENSGRWVPYEPHLQPGDALEVSVHRGEVLQTMFVRGGDVDGITGLQTIVRHDVQAVNPRTDLERQLNCNRELSEQQIELCRS